MRCVKALFFVFLSISPLFCDEEPPEDPFFGHLPVPWFTGPLLAPSGHTVPPGYANIQPYISFLTQTGSYDAAWHEKKKEHFHTLEVQVKTKIGLQKHLDLYLDPRMLYNQTQQEDAIRFADLPIALEIQIFRPSKLCSIPAIKLALRADIPSGRYQRLNPHKKGTDISGTGCWFPGSTLAVSQIWHLTGIHYLNLRGHFSYRFGVPTRVKGFNAYGGDSATRGTEYPGNLMHAGAAVQCSLSQSWVFACDFFYVHSNKNRFSGKTMSSMKNPSKEQFSLAPAIEYNWNKFIGTIGGVWFTFAGRNAPRFINGMWSLNAYF